MNPEFKDVEPVFDFLTKIGTRTTYGKVEVDLNESGYLLSDRVVVSKTQLDLFAAELWHASPELYRSFLESFPGANAGVFVGFAPSDSEESR